VNDLIFVVVVVLVKDNNSDLASRQCSHDLYVSFIVDLFI